MGTHLNPYIITEGVKSCPWETYKDLYNASNTVLKSDNVTCFNFSEKHHSFVLLAFCGYEFMNQELCYNVEVSLLWRMTVPIGENSEIFPVDDNYTSVGTSEPTMNSSDVSSDTPSKQPSNFAIVHVLTGVSFLLLLVTSIAI